MNALRLSSLLFLSLGLAGCGAALDVELVNVAHDQPSNVAMFFTVDTRAGEPVGGLTTESFNIYEDGRLVSVSESQQTIVNPEVAAEHFTLLLVDMSGSVTESDWVPVITEAASQFTQAVETTQQVAVYAFDGSEEIFPMQEFGSNRGDAARGVRRLGGFRTQDPSTNLNGALVRSTEVLTEAMANSEAALRFGTLVVFTDGTDRAARVQQGEMLDALDDARVEVFAIGVGNEIDQESLARIGSSGYVLIEDADALVSAFTTIGERIVGLTQRYYLLSYCSPSRAGEHEVTVEAVVGETRGSADYSFDATGFGPRCDPATPPNFASEGRPIQPRRSGRGGASLRIEVH